MMVRDRQGSSRACQAVPMIEFGNTSHVGLRRELNEDTY